MNKKKNNKKYILLLLMLSLSSVEKIYAIDCKSELIQRYQEIDYKYEIDYRYNIEKQSYTLILNYIKNENYDYQIYNVSNLECEQINETIKECHNFKPGKYKYEIYGQTEQCRQSVKVKEIEVKELSNYSSDPLCEGIEEFVLCQEDYYKELDYDTFVSRVNTYKKSKQKEEIKKLEEQKKNAPTPIDKILNYINENLTQVIIITVFVILLIISIIVTIISERKSRRLE